MSVSVEAMAQGDNGTGLLGVTLPLGCNGTGFLGAVLVLPCVRCAPSGSRWPQDGAGRFFASSGLSRCHSRQYLHRHVSEIYSSGEQLRTMASPVQDACIYRFANVFPSMIQRLVSIAPSDPSSIPGADPSYGGIPPVLDRVVCPPGEELGDGAPARPQAFMLRHDDFVLFGGPVCFDHRRVQVVMPSDVDMATSRICVYGLVGWRHLSRHCFPERFGKCFPTWAHFLVPSSLTRLMIFMSSARVHERRSSLHSGSALATT